MRISDWSSDVCSSDLQHPIADGRPRQDDAGEDGEDGQDDRLGADSAGHGPPEAAGRRFEADIAKDLDQLATDQVVALGKAAELKIGRASGRERVCQYV